MFLIVGVVLEAQDHTLVTLAGLPVTICLVEISCGRKCMDSEGPVVLGMRPQGRQPAPPMAHPRPEGSEALGQAQLPC